MLPQGKADIVRELQSHRKRVAMVGDGINDAIALASTDLGLGIVTGTAVALKADDIILVRDDLMVIVDAIGLSRKTLRTIKSNLDWAFGYNTAVNPIAAAGLLAHSSPRQQSLALGCSLCATASVCRTTQATTPLGNRDRRAPPCRRADRQPEAHLRGLLFAVGEQAQGIGHHQERGSLMDQNGRSDS